MTNLSLAKRFTKMSSFSDEPGTIYYIVLTCNFPLSISFKRCLCTALSASDMLVSASAASGCVGMFSLRRTLVIFILLARGKPKLQG